MRKPKRVQVKQLSKLNLSANGIGDEGASALAKMLTNENFPGLTLLDMRKNNIGETASNILRDNAAALLIS